MPARAVAQPDVAAADIISAATLASDPLIPGAALRPGVHLDLVGAYRPDMREADALALKRALLVVDTRAGGLAEAGDVVRHSGGVRKVRWTRTGSGKSGGVRVIYFIRREHEPIDGQVWLLFMYAKSNLDSIAGNKLKELKDAVEKTFIR
jgi:hypothetical protein